MSQRQEEMKTTVAQFICQICGAKGFTSFLHEFWYLANVAPISPGPLHSFFRLSSGLLMMVKRTIRLKKKKWPEGFSGHFFQFDLLKLIPFPFHWFC